MNHSKGPPPGTHVLSHVLHAGTLEESSKSLPNRFCPAFSFQTRRFLSGNSLMKTAYMVKLLNPRSVSLPSHSMATSSLGPSRSFAVCPHREAQGTEFSLAALLQGEVSRRAARLDCPGFCWLLHSDLVYLGCSTFSLSGNSNGLCDRYLARVGR